MKARRTPMRAATVCLAICLVLALLVVLPGCRPKVVDTGAPGGSPGSTTPPPAQPAPEPGWRIIQRLNPSAPGVSVPENVLPFAAVPGISGGTAFLGFWDLTAGTVTFDPVPLFEVSYAQGFVRVLWDGGRRIGVMTEPAGLPLANPSPAFAFDVIVPRWFFGHDIAACPSGTSELVVLRPEDIGQLQTLYGEGPDSPPRVYRLDASGAPAALTILPDHVEVVVFSWDESGLGDGRFHLFELKDGSLTAGPVSPVLRVVMAGPGARFGRAGSRVYVAHPGADLSYWDISTGEVSRDEILTSLLKAYETEYAPEQESVTPPKLHGFRGTLVVVCCPAAYILLLDSSGNEIGREFIQTMYIVAMRDGQVVGEVICHRGKLTVKKDGVVTQETDLTPDCTGEWQFPNAEAPETP